MSFFLLLVSNCSLCEGFTRGNVFGGAAGFELKQKAIKTDHEQRLLTEKNRLFHIEVPSPGTSHLSVFCVWRVVPFTSS